MSPHLLLLLASLGPGNCLQLWDTWGDGAEESPGPALSRARRQVDDEEDYDDYFPEATEPSQTLQMAADPEPVTMVDLLEQRASVVPGSPNLTSVETATRGLAGLDARGDAVGRLSTGLVTQWQPTTVHLATELTSVATSVTDAPFTEEARSAEPATREVLSMGLATTEAETMQPATTKAETMQPAATEAETTRPAATEAETTRPAATEAETTRPAATEAETTQPASTEAETTRPASTEAETTWPAATEFLPRKPKVIGIPVIEPAATSTTMSVSEESTDSVTFLGPSVTHKDNAVMAGNFSDIGIKNEQVVTPGSSVIPSSTGTSDRIPVRQCLLAILILALLVTIFLVCTVVLAVRLSRKNHTYPVRNYSPTEMVCISSLLPDGGEEAPIMANGDLPKSQGHTAGPTEDRDGDDLTLHSFLP